jgi:hypothetical protein
LFDVQTAIKALEPAYGEIAAADSTDLPAFGNGQRYVRHNDWTLFIGECKIWGGAEDFGRAIVQLVGYATYPQDGD